MKIRIDNLAKMEGHASFEGAILNENVGRAKMITEEGAKLIEGILIGRPYWQAPIITSRICGICPIVHFLCAIKALENAFKVKPKAGAIILRKILEATQIIHSHTLHLLFFSLPDFLKPADDFRKSILELRDWSLKTARAIGGRVIHPLTPEVGGFKKWPTETLMKMIVNNGTDVLRKAIKLGELFKRLKYPNWQRATEFIALRQAGEYAFYDGNLPKDFFKKIKEIEEPGELVKRVRYNKKSYMVGAIARVNLNWRYLNPCAKKLLLSFHKPPLLNPFYNIFCQAVEVVHFVEEITKLAKRKFKPINVSFEVKAGKGIGLIEAPRGTLYHYYELSPDGTILNCNIITPTAQFLNNLEDDLAIYLPKTLKLNSEQRQNKIKALIRAYDPCISCATH